MVSLVLRSMTRWPGWFNIGMRILIKPLLHTEGLGAIKDLLLVLVGLLNAINIQVSHRPHLSCDSELTLIQVTDAKRSITFTNHLQREYKFSLITLSALMIPVAMQAPAVISLTGRQYLCIGYFRRHFLS
jgi:hypothetical protein